MNSAPGLAAALARRFSSIVLVVWAPMATGSSAGGFRHHRLGHLDPLLEGHGGEVAGGTAGQQRAVGAR